MSDALIEALHADGPDREETELFGRFVGSWHLAWTGTTATGEPAAAQGELHVGYVLDGRAVQDVWIVPGRGEPGAGEPPRAFHGTTVRFFDRDLGAWRSTWIEPLNGLVRRFVGRPTDDGIELISDENEPRLRWSFSRITPESFVWTGESSRDGGRSWQRDEQMRATRTA